MSQDTIYRDRDGNILSEEAWYEAQADMETDEDYIDDFQGEVYGFKEESDDDYDFEDIDCTDCGLKFYVRPSLYGEGKKPWPRQCERCHQGLPPLYEY